MKSSRAGRPRVLARIPLIVRAGRRECVVPCRFLRLALLVALVALPTGGCGGDSTTSASNTSSPSLTSRPASSELSPSPDLPNWSPEKLRAALPGLLVARSEHPRLELASPDGARAVTLWTPPAGHGCRLMDCDPEQGRALLHVWDRRVELDEGYLVLLEADGSARRLELPENQHPTGGVLLAGGSVLCCSTADEDFHPTELLWTDGIGALQSVRTVGRLLEKAEQGGIVALEPMPSRKTVLVKTWALGEAILPATWREGTLTASGRPVRTGWLSGAPLASDGTVLMARDYVRENRLAVDLIEVHWADGGVDRRLILEDGPQSSGHDSITLVGAGPDGSALVLGWRLDGESRPTPEDEARPQHLQRLDLETGQFTVLPLTVRSDDGWLWLE